MAKFVWVVLVVASLLMAGSSAKLGGAPLGKVINILSIDGGGIKGIIPAVVLDHLDKALKAKDPTTNIVDYFDVVAETSTGGLIAGMLATQNPNGILRPPLTPYEIVNFYKEYGPHIFNLTRPWSPFSPFTKYDGEFLYNIIRQGFGDTRLSQALTKLVIPTYDVNKVKPVIFSTYKLRTDPNLDAKLSDICIGTSAAPLTLPPYYFENDGQQFNLIDGGIFAGNPTLVAVSEVKQRNKHNKIRLLSIGTGTTNATGQFDAESVGKWTAIDYLQHYDVVSADLTDYYLDTIFPHLNYGYDYLRIEEYNLDPSIATPDNVTKENLDNLEKEGYNLLQQNVLKINVDTFTPEETHLGTNAQALERLAEILYEERQLRLTNEVVEKGGKRPFIQTFKVPFDQIRAT